MHPRYFPRKEDFIWALVLFAMIITFCHGMIWKGEVPFFRDLGTYFYPLRFRLAEALKRGEILLWDRHEGMGFPLLADLQSGVFYIPHLFYLAAPFFLAVRMLFVFHYLVAAFGAYRLCRHWDLPPYLATIGAVVFTLGGAIVSLSNLLNHYQSAVWFPWVVFFWERALCSKSKKDHLFLVFCLLLQFLAGSPEIYAMTLGLLVLDGLRIKKENADVSISGLLVSIVGANVIAAGLGMIQLLPTVELFLESRGRFPVGYRESAEWALDPTSLINLFFLDKEVDANKFNGFHLFFLRDIPFLTSHYMGIVSLFGFALWLLGSSWKEKGLLLGLLFAGLLVAMGSHTPVYSLLYRYVPFFNLLRFPEKFFFLIHVLLVVVTLRGLHGFLEHGDRYAKRSLFIISAIATLWLALYLFCRFESAALIRFVSWAAEDALSRNLRTSSGVPFYLERQTALAIGILILLLLWHKRKVQPGISRCLIAAVVFVDLASAHISYQHTLEPDVVLRSDKVIIAPDSEPHRLFYYPSNSSLDPSAHVISRKHQPSFSEFTAILFSNLVPNAGMFHGFDYMQEIDALRRWPYLTFREVASRLPPENLYRLLGALNVLYITTFRQLPEGAATLVRHFPEYPSWLYRIQLTVPRTYVVSKTSQEVDPIKTIGRLSATEFDPLREVLLEKPLQLEAKPDFHGKATIVDYANHRVTIQAGLNGPGVLVLTDSFYPGWRVFVNGREADILRANLFFRGVFLQAGEHRVEFRYQPRSFFIGLVISLTTLGALIGVWAFGALRKRREARPGERSNCQIESEDTNGTTSHKTHSALLCACIRPEEISAS